jgi:hypothetical protein
MPMDLPDSLAEELLKNGVARKPDAPRVVYETKIVTPEAPEVASSTFRDVHVSHAQSAPIPLAGDPVLPGTDVPEPRVAYRGRRRSGRQNSNSR